MGGSMRGDDRSGSNQGRAQACAAALERMGWSPEAIDKILAGPDKSSVHDIAGRRVEARLLDTLDAKAVTELRAVSEPPAPDRDAPQAFVSIGQKDIADAVWVNLTAGDPVPLAAIARQLKRLPAPLQAYLLAASREVQRFYKDLQAWKRDFDRTQREAATSRGKDRKEGEAIAGAAAGVVAAVATAAIAANAVPGVGQVVSALMALGLAIGTAIVEANALPVRKAEDQIHPGYEGLNVFWGFPVEAPETPYANPYLALKQALVQDYVAFSLPAVPRRTRFDFAPRLSAFQQAAHELGLYPEDRTP